MQIYIHGPARQILVCVVCKELSKETRVDSLKPTAPGISCATLSLFYKGHRKFSIFCVSSRFCVDMKIHCIPMSRQLINKPCHQMPDFLLASPKIITVNRQIKSRKIKDSLCLALLGPEVEKNGLHIHEHSLLSPSSARNI